MTNIADIRLRFQIENYNDALYFTLDEYATIPADQIEQMKQGRYNDWRALIESANNQPHHEPTPEELAEEKRSIEEQIDTLQQRKQQIELIQAEEAEVIEL